MSRFDAPTSVDGPGPRHALEADHLAAVATLVREDDRNPALVVGLVATVPTVDAALAFFAAFSPLSVLTMGAVSLVWGHALGTGLTVYLETGAALVGIAVGLLLLAEQAGVVLG